MAITDTIKVAANEAGDEIARRTTVRSLFPRPPDAQRRNGKVIAIIASGGTFLGDDADQTKSPRAHDYFLDFIIAHELDIGFKELGLYQNVEGDFFLRDGTRIIYVALKPLIDSTNATYKERNEIVRTVEHTRNNNSGIIGVKVIQGTDTAAETMQVIHMLYGEDNDFSIDITTSQKTANAKGSDGPPNFWLGFRALLGRLFKQAFILSNAGREILGGVIRKISDNSFKIYSGRLLAELDMNEIRYPNSPRGVPSLDYATRNIRGSRLPEFPTDADYQHAVLLHYRPTADGDQIAQDENVIDDLQRSLNGEKPKPYNALVVYMAGSGNTPDHSNGVLNATSNILPIFAVSEVPGAETVDINGIPKYAASVMEQARKLELNNLIVLPATRNGPDMRPGLIMAYAAKFAEPRTPEFLLFCHLFSCFAWTSEDERIHKDRITRNRPQLIDAMQTLTDVRDRTRMAHPDVTQADMTQHILAAGAVREILIQYVGHIVDDEGRLSRDPAGRLTAVQGFYGKVPAASPEF